MKGRGEKGFTLIELLVVLALMAVLAAIGFNLDGWETRFRAESDMKRAYSDLMNARQTAATQKRMVFVQMTNNGYTVYADTDPAPDGDGQLETGPGQDTKLTKLCETFGSGVQIENPVNISISPDGLLSPAASIYFQSQSAPQLNCLALTPTDISMGLWNSTKNDCDIK